MHDVDVAVVVVVLLYTGPTVKSEPDSKPGGEGGSQGGTGPVAGGEDAGQPEPVRVC